jgi:hypothetical protein
MAITKWTISTQEKNAPLRAWARLFLSKESPEHAGAEALIVGCCAPADSGHAAAPPKQLTKYRRVIGPRSMCSPRCRSAPSLPYHQGRCPSLDNPVLWKKGVESGSV